MHTVNHTRTNRVHLRPSAVPITPYSRRQVVPPAPSSNTTPFALSSSRMRSASAKSLLLRASARASMRAHLKQIRSDIETAIASLRTEAKVMSNNLGIITAREEFTSQMINTLDDGAAKLTEADMNEEGANMLMLQTRQALGTTSLSLAGQAAQGVLRLF